MTPEKNNTVRWIAIIVGILIALGGWFAAGLSQASSTNIKVNAEAIRLVVQDVRENEKSIAEIRGGILVIQRELQYLTAAIDRLREQQQETYDRTGSE